MTTPINTVHRSNPKEKVSHHSPNLKIYLGLINPRSTLKFDLFLVEWTSCQGCAWKWIDFDLLLLGGGEDPKAYKQEKDKWEKPLISPKCF